MLRTLKRLKVGSASYQQVRYYVVKLSRANPIGVPKYFKVGIARLPGKDFSRQRASLANLLGQLVHKSDLPERKKAKVQSKLQAATINPF